MLILGRLGETDEVGCLEIGDAEVDEAEVGIALPLLLDPLLNDLALTQTSLTVNIGFMISPFWRARRARSITAMILLGFIITPQNLLRV